MEEKVSGPAFVEYSTKYSHPIMYFAKKNQPFYVLYIKADIEENLDSIPFRSLAKVK